MKQGWIYKMIIAAVLMMVADPAMAQAEADSLFDAKFYRDFDMSKFPEGTFNGAYPRYPLSSDPVEFIAYTYIDVDGDGKPELWLRDENQRYNAVYAIVGDSLELLADADARSDMEFYKGAVGYSGYYGSGKYCEGATVVRNSRPADYYMEEVIFSMEDNETILDEIYYLNDKESTSDECDKFRESLGEKIERHPVWHPIPEKDRIRIE